MEYLRKDIFYPSDGAYDDELIHCQREKYNEYLSEIRSRLPKSLVKAYETTDGFHDYCIECVSVLGAFRCYGLKGDIIRLELCLCENEISIEFSGVYYLRLLNENKESCWTDISNDEDIQPTSCGIEEIVLCELGLLEDNTYRFEILTANCATFEVHFKKVKVNMLNKRC